MTRFRFSESAFSPYFVSDHYKQSKAGQIERRIASIYYTTIYYKVAYLYTLARSGAARVWAWIQKSNKYNSLYNLYK